MGVNELRSALNVPGTHIAGRSDMAAATRARSQDASASTAESELLQAMLAHLGAGIALARQGLATATSTGNAQVQQFLRRCLDALEHAQTDGRSLHPEVGDQVSAATFAPGDGASDADVTPEEARGKPGGWPAF